MATTTTKPHSLPEASLAERLGQLQRDLEKQRRGTNMSTVITMALGVVILLVLGFYFSYGYNQFSSVTEPEKLVLSVQTLVSDKVPELRREIEKQVNTSAPDWAQNLSKQAQDAMPKAREQLENYALNQIDTYMEKGVTLTEPKFKEFLSANRAKIEVDMKELAESDTLAEKRLDELTVAVEEQIGADLKAQSREMFHALVLLNEKLKRLKENVGLTPEEQKERQLLMLARRLQQQNSGVLKDVGGIAIPANAEVGSEAAPVSMPPTGKSRKRSPND
jgi:hypothetical protein